MSEIRTFSSRAFCTVDEYNAQFSEGMRGAYVVVVCKAENLEAAVHAILNELAEYALTVRGFDFIADLAYADTEPSEYEAKLIERLDTYPVQFENVHYFPPDS